MALWNYLKLLSPDTDMIPTSLCVQLWGENLKGNFVTEEKGSFPF